MKKPTYCPNCGINLVITDDLKKEKYIKCLSCGYILKNPYYTHRQWIIALIIGIVFIIGLLIHQESTSNKDIDRIDAMTGVKSYLKYHYLNDPDSYQAISWDAFGPYNEKDNTYFMLHTFRAKNIFGGYVVEQKLFVLDSKGNVKKIVDDIDDMINGY